MRRGQACRSCHHCQPEVKHTGEFEWQQIEHHLDGLDDEVRVDLLTAQIVVDLALLARKQLLFAVLAQVVLEFLLFGQLRESQIRVVEFVLELETAQESAASALLEGVGVVGNSDHVEVALGERCLVLRSLPHEHFAVDAVVRRPVLLVGEGAIEFRAERRLLIAAWWAHGSAHGVAARRASRTNAVLTVLEHLDLLCGLLLAQMTVVAAAAAGCLNNLSC